MLRAECIAEHVESVIVKSSVLNEEVASDMSPTLENFIGWMYDSHADFAKLLSGSRVMRNDAINIARWINEELVVENKRERWWSPEALSNHSSVGKSWNYGRTPTLDKYSIDLSTFPHEK